MRGSKRGEPRLDPVRWRRPGRSTVFRSALVATLTATAALVMWARPGTCAPPCRPAPMASQPSAGVRDDPVAAPPELDRAAVPAGSVGVPIRLAEPTALKLIHPGDRVDVFRVRESGPSPEPIAAAALVLGVTGAEDPTAGGLLLALTPAEARSTITTPGTAYAVLIRPG